MILTARAMDCQYIWHAHGARSVAGISEAFVDALRTTSRCPPCPLTSRSWSTYVQELFRLHKTSPATFQAALTQFGARRDRV